MSIARRLSLALMAGLAFSATPARASVEIYTNTGALYESGAGSTVTMAQLNAGYYIEINDKLFNNFLDTYSSVSLAGGATPIAASSIVVTPLDTPGDNPGLEYQGPFLVKPGQELDTAWSYTVSTLNGKPTIEDSSLSLGGTTFSAPVSSISVGETVSDGSGHLLAPLSTYEINAPPVTGNVFDIKFYHPVNLVNVSKDILLDASASTGNPVTGTPTGFTTMVQRFSETPEPSTMALAALGALGFVGYGVRRRKAKGA